jgi:hypothetical protein
MRRVVLLGSATAIAVAGGAVAGIAATAAASQPTASLTDFVCHRAVQDIDRSISVEAVMRPVAGTRRMEVRFELRMIGPRGGVAPVNGGDLGAWLSPTDPATLGQNPNDVWTIDHPVDDLVAPATYRFKVSFRWIGLHAHILSERSLFSEKCFQPDLRPDLLVQKITVTAVSSTQGRYVAVIRNAGPSAAVGPFEVALTTPHGVSAAPAVTIRRLAPHRSRDVTFLGPVCTPAAPPIVTVDPGHVVDDQNPSNNSLQARCPAPASTTAGPPSTAGSPNPPLHSKGQ